MTNEYFCEVCKKNIADNNVIHAVKGELICDECYKMDLFTEEDILVKIKMEEIKKRINEK